MESHMVKEMIEKTIFSVSVDDLQYHLSSIFWERVETENGFLLRLISTDGHRLTLIERPLPGSEEFSIEKGILIPRKGMAEVIRFLAEEEKVSLGLGTQSLALKADDRYLFIRLLLDKKFPEYRRIIPETFGYRFAINRRELFETIKRISLLSSERFKGVVLKLLADQVEVTFTNPEVGEGREVVPAFLEAGDPAGLPIEVGFNARYFLEPLNAMASDMVHPGSERQGPPLPPGGPGRSPLLQHHHAHEPVKDGFRVPVFGSGVGRVGWALPAMRGSACRVRTAHHWFVPKSFWWHRHLAGAAHRLEACATKARHARITWKRIKPSSVSVNSSVIPRRI